MSAFVRFGICLIGWLGLTAGAAAVEVVNGSWTLQANALLPEQEIPCSFEGSAQVVQDGNEFNGTAALTLSGGPDACPAEMMASINGVIDGTRSAANWRAAISVWPTSAAT